MSQYFPKPFNSHFGDSIKVKIDLSYHTTKTDVKNISHVDTSSFALKTNLSSLKTDVDKLDIDKLKPLLDDVSKLSNVVTNEVVKKTEYDKLVGKANNTNTSDFVLNTKYNTDKTELENKIPYTSSLMEKSDYNTKISEIESKLPSISNLATTSALTSVENKIHMISNLVKKTDHNTKITEIENKITNHKHDEYITTPQFNKLAAIVFNARIVQENLITKTDFNAKLSSLNR